MTRECRRWRRYGMTLAVGVSAIMWFTFGTAGATTVGEVFSLSAPVYETMIRLSLDAMGYRMKAEGRSEVENCIFQNSQNFIQQADAAFRSEKAKSDEQYRKQLSEEIIARMIYDSCIGPKSNAYKVAAPEKFLPVHELFEKFPERMDKVYIVAIAIGTQAAFDLVDSDKDRGECAIEEFLSGNNAPGWRDLVSTFRNKRSSPDSTIEEVIVNLVAKRCGWDGYQKSMKIAKDAIDFLEEDNKRLKKEIEKENAAIIEMLKHADRVPDGRAIFEGDNGKWIFEDGKTIVPDTLVRQRIAPPPGGWPNVNMSVLQAK